MTDPNQQPLPEKEDQNQIKEPTQQDGTNWEENQRIDEEGNEHDPEDVK